MTSHFYITLKKIWLLGKCSSISFPHSGKIQCYWWLVIVDEGHYKAISIHQSVDHMGSKDSGCIALILAKWGCNSIFTDERQITFYSLGLLSICVHYCSVTFSLWIIDIYCLERSVDFLNELITYTVIMYYLHLPILSLFSYHYYM